MNGGVVEFTRALVRVPSVSDRGEAPAARLVAELMRSWGWGPVVEEVAPGRPNVHAVLDGDRPGPTLLLCGHTDVVTEGDRERWTVDPYGADVVDGRLYGRGSADMKGGLAAMLHAARAVQEAGPFPGRIVVAAFVDEEGMMAGSKHFVAAGHAAGIDAAIVCEPEAEEVCLSAKGAIRLRVDVHGRMAHGAMPQHGRNPVPVLALVLAWLTGHQDEVQRRVGEHPQLGLPYLTPTVVRAGDPGQLNVIGDHAWAGIDIRTVPGVDHGTLVDEIGRAARRIAAAHDTTAELTVVDDRPPTETGADEPVARAVLTAHEQVTGSPATIGGVPGATDGTILWRDAGLPVVVYGPGGKWIAHQTDEYVEVADIERKTLVYAAAVREFLGAS